MTVNSHIEKDKTGFNIYIVHLNEFQMNQRYKQTLTLQVPENFLATRKYGHFLIWNQNPKEIVDAILRFHRYKNKSNNNNPSQTLSKNQKFFETHFTRPALPR